MISRRLFYFAPSALALAGCGGGRRYDAGDYVGGTIPLECAPFARALSGVRLWGPAADWWDLADGRYQRATQPEIGAVLVFRRSPRLREGHAAVVSQVISSREVLVTQANWVRHRVTADQPVIDVSEQGDWSAVRVWWPESGQMGTTAYAAHGFIRSGLAPSHQDIASATPRAIRIAMAGDLP